MKNYTLGIDFGNSNIKVSFYDEAAGRVRQLKIDKSDNTGDMKVPNVIAYTKRDDYIVGRTAIKTRSLLPQNVVDGIKRKLELERWKHEFPSGGFTLNAEDIAEDTFRWIRHAIEEQGRGIESAVITVPVCFTEIQKSKIFCAAKNAGIPVACTVTEPVAALFSIEPLFEDPGEEAVHTVVVFDFGGATLDLCLCSAACGGGEIRIQVEASSGVHLGGTDLTDMIYRDCVYPKHRQVIDEEFRLDTLNRMEQLLFDLVENMKTELFADELEELEDYLVLPYTAREIEVKLTREEVLRCFAAHEVDRQILRALDSLFEDSAFLEKQDVSMVKAFGGTSRVPFFRELLANYFGEAACDIDDYDAEEAYTAVADGAARYMNILRQEDSPVVIRNAIPFFVGVSQNGVFQKVIQRNAKYGIFTPSRNLSRLLRREGEWTIALYQSFLPDPGPVTGADGAVYLGSIRLHKERYTAFERIQYKFGVDHSGRIVGRFYEVDAENEQILREEVEIAIGG